MSERKEQIKEALSWLWTGLTGTKKEILAKADEIGQDVDRQVKERRRRLNHPADLQVDADEDPKR